MWGALVSSTYNSVAFALERYVMIVHPLVHRTRYTPVCRRLVLAAVWLSGFVYQGTAQLPTTGVREGVCVNMGLWPNDTVRFLFALSSVGVYLLIPLVLFIFAYSRIFVVLWRRDKLRHGRGQAGQGHETEGQDQVGKTGRLSRAQMTLLRSSLAVSVMFVACWFTDITLFLLAVTNLCVVRNAFTRYVDLMIFVNPLGNAIIYSIQFAEFRQGVRRMCWDTLFCCGSSWKGLHHPLTSTKVIKVTSTNTDTV